MEAKLKRLHSPDIYNLEDFQPDAQDDFCFLLQAMIGPAGEEGEESFDIEVCTPKWIEKRHRVDEVVVGLHYLIVREYNYQRIVKAIEKFLQGCSGKDWSDVSNKVSRLGLWEFEGYEKGE
jgi:hypothetical protein